MEVPASSDMSSCSSHSVTVGISAFSWPSSRTRHADCACLPQRSTGFLRPWMMASFAAASAFSGSSLGTEELSPSLPDTKYDATRFAHSLAVLGHLPNRNTVFSDTSSRSCNFVMPTFTSSVVSRYLSISFANFSKAIPRLRLSSIRTQQPSSLADDGLCCGNGVCGGPVGARWGFCHCSLILNVMPLVLPTLLLCTVSSLAFQPSSSVCHEVVLFSLLYQKAGKYCCLLSSSPSGCTLEIHIFVFLAPASISKASMSTFVWTAIFQVILHCSHDLFFPTSSNQLPPLPDPLATVFHSKKRTKFVAVVRSASFGPCPIAND